jgi:hypothetical protein
MVYWLRCGITFSVLFQVFMCFGVRLMIISEANAMLGGANMVPKREGEGVY